MTIMSLLRAAKNTTWNFLVHPVKLGVYHILKGVKAPYLTRAQRVSHVALGVFECCVPLFNYAVAFYEDPNFNAIKKIVVLKKQPSPLPEYPKPKLPDELKYLEMDIPQVVLQPKKVVMLDDDLITPAKEDNGWVYKAVAITLIFLAITGIVLPFIRNSATEEQSAPDSNPDVVDPDPSPVTVPFVENSIIHKINNGTCLLTDNLWIKPSLNHQDLNPFANAKTINPNVNAILDGLYERGESHSNTTQFIHPLKMLYTAFENEGISSEVQGSILNHTLDDTSEVIHETAQDLSTDEINQTIQEHQEEVQHEIPQFSAFVWLGYFTMPFVSLYYGLGLSKKKTDISDANSKETKEKLSPAPNSNSSVPKKERAIKRHSDGGGPQRVIINDKDKKLTTAFQGPSTVSKELLQSSKKGEVVNNKASPKKIPLKEVARPAIPASVSQEVSQSPKKVEVVNKASTKKTPPKKVATPAILAVIPPAIPSAAIPPAIPVKKGRFQEKSDEVIDKEIVGFMNLKGLPPTSLAEYTLPQKKNSEGDALAKAIERKGGNKLQLELAEYNLKCLENSNTKGLTLAEELLAQSVIYKQHVENRREIILNYNNSSKDDKCRTLCQKQITEWYENYTKLKEILVKLHGDFSELVFLNEAIITPQELIREYNNKCLTLLKSKVLDLKSLPKEVEENIVSTSSIPSDPIQEKIEYINTLIKDLASLSKQLTDLANKKESEQSQLDIAQENYGASLYDAEDTTEHARTFKILDRLTRGMATREKAIKEKIAKKKTSFTKLKEEIALFSTVLKFNSLALEDNEQNDVLIKAQYICDQLKDKKITEIPKPKPRFVSSPARRSSKDLSSGNSIAVSTPPKHKTYRPSQLSKVSGILGRNVVENEKTRADYIQEFYLEKACAIANKNLAITVNGRKKTIQELNDSIPRLEALKESLKNHLKDHANNNNNSPHTQYQNTYQELTKKKAELLELTTKQEIFEEYMLYISESNSSKVKFTNRWKDKAEEYANEKLGLRTTETVISQKPVSPCVDKDGWLTVTRNTRSPKPEKHPTPIHENLKRSPLTKNRHQNSPQVSVSAPKTPFEILKYSSMLERAVGETPPERQSSTESWASEPVSPKENNDIVAEEKETVEEQTPVTKLNKTKINSAAISGSLLRLQENSKRFSKPSSSNESPKTNTEISGKNTPTIDTNTKDKVASGQNSPTITTKNSHISQAMQRRRASIYGSDSDTEQSPTSKKTSKKTKN